jgi:hypothetical protein
MLAGVAGLLAAEHIEGERDVVYDALVGAAVIGSHVVLDKAPYMPDMNFGPKLIGMPVINWAIDAAMWGYVAYLIWPKDRSNKLQDAASLAVQPPFEASLA